MVSEGEMLVTKPIVVGLLSLTHLQALCRPLRANSRCLENSCLPSGLSIMDRLSYVSNPYFGPLGTKPPGSDGGILKAGGYKERTSLSKQARRLGAFKCL